MNLIRDWPGIGAVYKITAFKPPNHNKETLRFSLRVKGSAKVSFKGKRCLKSSAQQYILTLDTKQ